MIAINKAELDMRGKTHFLRIEGTVEVESFEDEVAIEYKGFSGINPLIPIFEIIVTPSNGPKKIQPAAFSTSQALLAGGENICEVQVITGADSITSPLTVLNWADENRMVKSLIGKLARVYTTGDMLTEDYNADRVNFELTNESTVARIWLG